MSRPTETVLVPPLTADADGEPAEPPERLCIDVAVEDDRWRALGDIEAWTTTAASAVARHVRAACGDVTIAFTDDEAVRALNRQFRGQDKATNVLSFEAGPHAHGHLGDVILARQTVVREATSLDIPVAHHVTHLVIHGLLHLVGYDHQTGADADAMERLETQLLASLAIPDPYAGSAPV